MTITSIVASSEFSFSVQAGSSCTTYSQLCVHPGCDLQAHQRWPKDGNGDDYEFWDRQPAGRAVVRDGAARGRVSGSGDSFFQSGHYWNVQPTTCRLGHESRRRAPHDFRNCHSGDFTQTNNCGTPLPVGGVCSINVVFSPTAEGPRSGSLTVTSNGSGSPHSITLAGTGLYVLPFLSSRQ